VNLKEQIIEAVKNNSHYFREEGLIKDLDVLLSKAIKDVLDEAGNCAYNHGLEREELEQSLTLLFKGK
jgi:hypothetical protein